MSDGGSSPRAAVKGRRFQNGPSPGFMLALVGAALIVGLLLRAAVPGP